MMLGVRLSVGHVLNPKPGSEAKLLFDFHGHLQGRRALPCGKIRRMAPRNANRAKTRE